MRLEGTSHRDTLDPNVIDWLLEEDQPSVRYHTLVDLRGRKPDDPEVKAAYSTIPRVGWAHDLLRTQKPKGYWEAHEPRTVREWVAFLRFPLYDSSIWKGIVLSDLGLTATNPRVRRLADRIFEYKLHLSSEVNLFTEEVCIVGNVARMLTRFGYYDDRRVRKLYDWMIEDQREDGGWNCSTGTPGTLDAWEALAAFAATPKAKRSGRIERSISRGAEFYLERRLFREGRRYAPWFRLHYPNHYFYDIMVGLDLMTELGYSDDRRLQPALKILMDKRRPDGTWLLDRVHPDIEPAEGFTRKPTPFVLEAPGKPSKWITLTALRVLKRIADAS
jgi:hypothetical protein